jgi:uncharacterized protein (DUF362 family)
MHAIYIRGAILRGGGPLLRATAYARQLGGAVGGWAASVKHHARWRDAPLSRVLASAITLAGTITGKIPPAVRRVLEYGSFRTFCEFNIDAERTAASCWNRIIELAANDDAYPPELIHDFRRIAADEDRHERIFTILANALTDDDRVAESAESLAAKIAEVGEAFLPRSMRKKHPLGSGGTVFVTEGGDDKRAVLRRILDDARIADRVRGKSVAIKPTFMLGYDRRDRSLFTDPELVDELARALRSYGASDVAVIEAPNIYDHFYRRRSVAEVARYLGYESDQYRLVDASEEQVAHDYSRGLAQSTVSRTWRDAGFRISFAKLRSHPIELAYLSVPNVEWLGARCDQYLFAERQAQRQTAILMMLDDFPPDFALIDAFDSAADGIIGAMGCTRPKSPRRIYAGDDALAVDLVAMRHIGIHDTRQSSVMEAAVHWFGAPNALRVEGCDTPIAGWRGPYDNELWAMLSVLAYPVYVVGSGRGALFVPEMDESAFPPIAAEGAMLRFTRGATRRLIGLHHSR